MALFNSLGSNYTLKHLPSMLFGFSGNGRRDLESYIADHYSPESVTLTYKGREALYLALKSLPIEPKGKVIINGYTCYAVYDAVVKAGFEPFYLDVERRSLNYSAKSLKQALSKHSDVVAVIVQNTLGFPADIEGISKIAKSFSAKNSKRKVYFIEDLAHSIGMKYENGVQAGMYFSSILSFSQDKVVDSVSGGAYISREPETADFKYKRLPYLRFLKDYYYIINTLIIRTGYIWGGGIVYNYALRKLRFLPKPMDGDAGKVHQPDHWHANLALFQFDELEKTLDHRKRIASIYKKNLPKHIQLEHSEQSIYLRFPLFVAERSELLSHLKSKGMHFSDTWYDSPVSPKRHLKDTNYKLGDCPHSEVLSEHMVNLPTHINVSEVDAYRITKVINKWLS